LASQPWRKSSAYFIGKGSPIYLNRIDPAVDYVVYGKIAGVPVLVLVVTGVFLVAHFLQNSTKLGQYLYALGENRQAALEAGISEKKIMYSFFILSAVLAASAGILLVGRLRPVSPTTRAPTSWTG